MVVLAAPQMWALVSDITCLRWCGAAGQLGVTYFRCGAIARADLHIAFPIGIAMGANAALSKLAFFIAAAIFLARSRFVHSISTGTGVVTKLVFGTIGIDLTKGHLARLVGTI